MPNVSEGLRSLFAYTTFGLLAVAGGAIWTAHSELNARTDAAVVMVQDLVLGMQDTRLELAKLNLTNLINSRSSGFPTIPPPAPPLKITVPLEVGLLKALASLRKAEGHLSAGNYWLVDDDVKEGFMAMEAAPPNLTIEKLELDPFLGSKVPRQATILGWSALGSAVLTVLASLDVDGQGGGHLSRLWKKRFP